MKEWKIGNIWKHKILCSVIGILCAAAILTGALSLVWQQEESVNYREETVTFGMLVQGVTESGSVDIGTVEQTFDLDMSALQRAATGSTSSSGSATGSSGFSAGSMGGGNAGGGASGGGMDMFSQIFSMASGSTTSSGTDSTLTVDQVCISVGQQVQEGDVLYELEAESVTELEEQLQTNVEKAQADLDAVYADQTASKLTAQYNYESSLAYGSYADTEYQSTVKSLQDAVEQAHSALDQAQASLTDYEAQLADMQTAYEEALGILEAFNWSVENADKWTDTWKYVSAFESAQSAQSTVDSLEQKVSQLERNVEQAQSNVTTATQEYQAAKRNLAQGLLSAGETLSLRNLAYSTAQETYDIALAYLEESVTQQEEIYQETREKWEEFSSHISGTSVCSQYNGVITSVSLAEGDSIGTGTVLIELYDMDQVSMTVTVDEADMTDIAVGSQANISFTAYPDILFQATVTEIADGVTDSSGNVTYDVTATLEGDVSGLFQGMTGEITFVTDQTEEVVYVSRRAITTEGEDSYVKVKNADGKIETRKVTTGFTDGTYVEIVEGLAEGEIVLIESKVSGS